MTDTADAASWDVVDQRHRAFADLAATVDGIELPCPACGYPTMSELGSYGICEVCRWEDDGTTRSTPDRPTACNRGRTLRQAGENIERYGVCDPPSDPMSAPEYWDLGVLMEVDVLREAFEQLLAAPTRAALDDVVRQRDVARQRFLVVAGFGPPAP